MFHDGNLQFDGLSGPNLFYPLAGVEPDRGVLRPAGAGGRLGGAAAGALFGVSLALVLWWLVRDLLPPAGAALAVALAVATPQFTVLMTDGLADLVLAAYVTVCALAAYRWLEDGGSEWASLSGLRGRRRRLDEARGSVVLPGHPGGGAARAPLAAHARRSACGWRGWRCSRCRGSCTSGSTTSRSTARTSRRSTSTCRWIVGHVSQHARRDGALGRVLAAALALIALTRRCCGRRRTGCWRRVTLPNLVLTLGAYVTHYRAGNAGSVEATAHRLYLHLAPRCRRAWPLSALQSPSASCARGAATQPTPTRKSPPSLLHEPASPCRPDRFALVLRAARDQRRTGRARSGTATCCSGCVRVRAAAAGAVGWRRGRSPGGWTSCRSSAEAAARSWARPCSRWACVIFCSRSRSPARQDRTRRDLTQADREPGAGGVPQTGHPEQFAGGHRGRHPGIQRVDQHRAT